MQWKLSGLEGKRHIITFESNQEDIESNLIKNMDDTFILRFL